MKRPLCVIGFSYLAAMTAGAFLSWSFCLALAGIFLASAAVAAFSVQKHRAAALGVLCSAGAAFAVMGAYLYVSFYPALALDGQTAEISGTVTEIRAGLGRVRYTVETDSVGVEGAPQKLKIVLLGYGSYDMAEYDRVSCQAKLFAFGEETALEERMFYRSGGVSLYGGIIGEPVSAPPESRTAGYFISRLRDRLTEGLELLLPGWRGDMLTLMLTGMDTGLEPGVKHDFTRAGMGHILAISGLHMVTLTGTLDRVLEKTKLTVKSRGILCAAAALAYMFIAGLGVSVVRSGVMLIVRHLGLAFGRRADGVNSLGLAAGVVLLADPLAAVDAGFLMSVLGSLSIITLASHLKGWMCKMVGGPARHRAVKYLLNCFSVSVCAWCCTSPVSALMSGSLSMVAIPANILAAPFSGLTISMGMLTALCAALGIEPLALGFGWIAGTGAWALRMIAQGAASLPFAAAPFSQDWLIVWMFGTLALCLLPAALGKGAGLLRYSAALSAIALLMGMTSNAVLMRDVISIRVTGDGALACSKNGSTVLVTEGLSADSEFSAMEAADAVGGEVELFVSINGDPASELPLAKEHAKSLALLSAPAAERLAGSQLCGRGTAILWDNGKTASRLDIYPGAYALDTGETKLLYIFGECDIMELPPEYRRSAIVVLSGEEPRNKQALACSYLLTPHRGQAFDGAAETLLLGSGGQGFYIRGENIARGR